MPRKGVWRIIAMMLAATLILAACGDDDDEDTGATGTGGEPTEATEVAIGFVGAKTGDNANLGLNIRDGMKLAIDEFNAEGGDVKVVLKEFDTAGDPAQAATIKDQFLGDEDVIGIVGPAFSGETKALIPDLQDAGLVMVSASATNKDLPTVVPDATVFHRIIADDTLQASGVAKYLSETEKPKAAAYVHDNSEYGKGLTDDVQKLTEAKGIKTAATEVVDPKAQDFSATVNKVIASKADVVFYGGYYAEAGRFKKQLQDNGFAGKFVSGDGSLDPGFVESAGAAAEGARLSCPCNLALETSSGKLKEFYDSFKSEIGKEPGLYSPEGYDATKILIAGIEAGNTTREKLLTYVEEEIGTYEGISKTIEFEENGNLKSTTFFVFEIKGGKISPLQELEADKPATTETTAASTTSTT